MCQAFSAVPANVTLIVNKRVLGSNKAVDDLYKFKSDFTIQRIYSSPLVTSIFFTFHLSALIFVFNALLHSRRTEYDIFYTRDEWITWMLSFFIPSKKIIWESHEAKFNLPARRILKKGIKTIVISEGIYTAYIKRGVDASQMLIAHDAIDESFFGPVDTQATARERLGLSSDSKIAMYIGGFDAWKGVETFFKAASLTKDTLYVAIGGTELQVAEYTKQYPDVVFLGSKPYSDLKDYQQAADILVIPNTATNTLSANYTSPLKLFAHMTSGIPLLLSDIPSLKNVTGTELVTFFEADNAIALDKGVTSIVLDAAKKKQNALVLKRISEKYTWTERTHSIIKFISA